MDIQQLYIGVHQDGLVHVSQLADRFIKDPHEVVKAGDIVRVRVTEVDVSRKRIGLSMRKDGGAQDRPTERKPPQTQHKARGQSMPKSAPQSNRGSFGDLLQSAMKKN